ncbi:MAG: family 78 glycoside hydrolase catalytic domain [Alistipes sp.]|nr:family 78 glycoside hydrolase catalytic domain [Alistipes sp.]
MKLYRILPAILLLLAGSVQAAVQVGGLRTERMERPLNIESQHPRLSWVIESNDRGVLQKAYRVLVASSPEALAAGKGDLWDSGRVESDESVWVPYDGAPLKSNARCYWKVKVWTSRGESAWSRPAEWGMGLLGETHWGGRWIGWDAPFAWDVEDSHSKLSARCLRTEFRTDDVPVRRATLHICGLGLYELYIDGERVGNQVLAPAPSDYRRTVIYNSFDVTDRLAGGDHAIGVMLGNGRYYTMRQNYKPHKIPTFGYPKVRLNLIIEYADGRTQRVVTTERGWRLTADGPIRSNNEYDGEIYDARKELGDWTRAGYDDSSWLEPQRVSLPYGTLRGNRAPNMRVMKRLPAVRLERFGDRCIADFGQNMAGWIRIRLRHGREGDTIRIRYAELLKNEGRELDVENLRHSRSTDYYICNGRENGGSWAARFSYHGFRYAEITGCDDLTADDLTAEFVYDEMADTGSFESSDETLNAICRNAWWGYASNYKGVPLDCPQRDERQPWLGDHAMNSWGESFLFDNANLYAKWTDDMREAQREDGCIPDICPAFYNYYTSEMTWSSTLPVVCEMLWQQYGDTEPVRRNYGAIKRWMKHIRDNFTTADGVIDADKYGDWCVPPESPDLIHSRQPERRTDGALIATAYYYKVSRMLAEFARLQRLDDEAEAFEHEAATIRDRFNARFLTVRRGTSPTKKPHILHPDSVFYGNNTVTSNLLPLAFDMVPDDCREEVEKNLIARIITTDNGHIGCGVIGVNWLMRQLSRMGRGDVACLLATNRSYPSWGYMVDKGATTIWELWNGDTAARTMNSANHVMMLGDLLAWCFRDLGGLNPARPGYKEILLRPDFSIEQLSHVRASHVTPYGEVVSSWHKTLMHLDWEVTVPCNTTALLVLPTTDERAIKEHGVKLVGREPNATVWRVPSGNYRFSVDLNPAERRDRKGLLCEEFLYEKTSFPECHSATIAETPAGDLVTAFFGGTKERNPDVCIWVCRKPKGADRWTAPMQVADGIVNDTLRYACWNPVLFQVPEPDGELWLFYKVGPNVAGWKGYLIRSRDGGRTWSAPEEMPVGFLGPAKNKPVWVDGRILLPCSTEGGHWNIYFEWTDDRGATWHKTGALASEPSVQTQNRTPDSPDAGKMEAIHAIQPSILQLADGRLMQLCRTRNAKIGTAVSSDKGETWSRLELSDVENNQSGIDAVTLHDGRHALVYNDFETLAGTRKGPRTPLSLAVSDDDGKTWRHVMTLEDCPISQYSYPAVIEASDGTLHIVYTWRRRRIKHLQVRL